MTPSLSRYFLASSTASLIDIPDGVAINEAVEIAKKYGQESSGGFVNAILAKIMKSGE